MSCNPPRPNSPSTDGAWCAASWRDASRATADAGFAHSIYVRDPDDNEVELYVDIPGRLGHVVRITQDIEQPAGGTRVGPLAAWIRDRGIVLETCPSSNLHTGAIRPRGDQMTDHPIALLDSLGFRGRIRRLTYHLADALSTGHWGGVAGQRGGSGLVRNREARWALVRSLYGAHLRAAPPPLPRRR